MTAPDIQKEWDSFIEYPDGSSKLYATTTSALLFAQHIADIAAEKEREACAKLCDELQDEDGYDAWSTECAAAIRARGNT